MNHTAFDAVSTVIDGGTENVNPIPAVKLPFSPWQMAGIAWAAGAVILLAYQTFRHIRFVRTTRRWSVASTSGPANELLQKLKEDIGLKKSVNLFRCSCISTPMAIGLFHCRILLPHLDYDTSELQYILMHELVHLKRRDLLYRILTMLATAIHWYNPIVHLTGRAIDLLCEMSCDGEIVRETNSDDRLCYSETIIGVVKYQAHLQTAFSTSFYGGEKGMKMRILSIMDTGRKKAGAALVCAAMILSAGTGFAFAANSPVQTPGDNIIPAIGSEVLLDIISRMYWNREGNAVLHDPMEGQISEEQAVAIAKDAVSRLMRHLTVDSVEYAIEMDVTSTYLEQQRLYGQEQVPLDPQYSFWAVELRVSGSSAPAAAVLIHATTGTPCEAKLHYINIASDVEVSVDKLLSGYMEDLGLGGFEYDRESFIAAGELKEDIAYKAFADGASQVAAYIAGWPYMRDGEDFGKITRIDLHVTLDPPESSNS
jgi:beta-lactamase regulating signal transducer with metallopeptidase domain